MRDCCFANGSWPEGGGEVVTLEGRLSLGFLESMLGSISPSQPEHHNFMPSVLYVKNTNGSQYLLDHLKFH